MNSECNKELSREDMAMKIKAYQFAVTDISYIFIFKHTSRG